MMMRQMDAITRLMEQREKEDKCKRARERKRSCKHRARREAKRRVRQASLGDLNDHGGKQLGFFSESSAFDSTSSSGSDGDNSQDSGYGKGQWRCQKVGSGEQEVEKNVGATKGGEVVLEVD
jgi:hypothetical protein